MSVKLPQIPGVCILFPVCSTPGNPERRCLSWEEDVLTPVDPTAAWKGKAEQGTAAAKSAPDVLVTPTPEAGAPHRAHTALAASQLTLLWPKEMPTQCCNA